MAEATAFDIVGLATECTWHTVIESFAESRDSYYPLSCRHQNLQDDGVQLRHTEDTHKSRRIGVESLSF